MDVFTERVRGYQDKIQESEHAVKLAMKGKREMYIKSVERDAGYFQE